MEPIDNRHLLREPKSQVRDNLILKWLFMGTLLALMYRSVLLATLVSVDYEKQGRCSTHLYHNQNIFPRKVALSKHWILLRKL